MEEANGRERGGREGYLFGWGMGNDITWVPGPTTWVLARVGGVDREFRNSRLTVESDSGEKPAVAQPGQRGGCAWWRRMRVLEKKTNEEDSCFLIRTKIWIGSNLN